MATDTALASTGTVLGYARVSTGHQSLDQQVDALTVAGVDPARVYSDKLSGTSTREQRPGLAALLDYARQGDAIVVVGIDRLGRNAAEVMTTIRDLGQRDIVLRSLREGIDAANATGRMVAGVLASLAELELEFGSGAPLGSSLGTAGSWSVDWPAQGFGLVECCAGAADACERRECQHDCRSTWGEPGYRLPRIVGRV
jgi:Resolvase, N terminal domain